MTSGDRYPYRITYDYECYFDTKDLPSSSDKLTWRAKHVPLSVSVCSNVPGYEKPQCLITEGKPEDLVSRMIEYMKEGQKIIIPMAQKAATIMTERLKEIHRPISLQGACGRKIQHQMRGPYLCLPFSTQLKDRLCYGEYEREVYGSLGDDDEFNDFAKQIAGLLWSHVGATLVTQRAHPQLRF